MIEKYNGVANSMEEQEIKVSVIVPVYNVEKYLRQCVESICAQTLKEIEILLIDDGSSDSSSEIIDEFAKKDPRVRVFKRQNCGAGAERNFGIERARGKYLSILDSDDWFDAGMLEMAYKACEEKQADFSVFKADLFDSATGKHSHEGWILREDIVPKKDVFSYKDIDKNIFRIFNGWAWDKLYSRDFVIREGLKFQEQRTTNDLFFVYAALVKAKRITVVHKTLAHHRADLGQSLSNTREKSWDCFYHALMALKSELEKMRIYEEVKQSFVNYALHFTFWNMDTLSGPALVKLYNALRDEWFKNLDVEGKPAEYFYSPEEFARYEWMRDHDSDEYLIHRYDELKKTADEAAKALGYGSIFDVDIELCRELGKLARPKKMAKAFVKQCREGGFKSAVAKASDRLK